MDTALDRGVMSIYSVRSFKGVLKGRNLAWSGVERVRASKKRSFMHWAAQ